MTTGKYLILSQTEEKVRIKLRGLFCSELNLPKRKLSDTGSLPRFINLKISETILCLCVLVLLNKIFFVELKIYLAVARAVYIIKNYLMICFDVALEKTFYTI